MSAPRLFALDASEPLGFVLLSPREPHPCEDAVAVRFELTSRGDRVPGRLLLPSLSSGQSGGGLPFPWLLIQHGSRASKDDVAVSNLAADAVERGIAVAAIDLPLHGERSSAKLGERVLGRVERGEPLADLDAELWIDFVRQSVCDLRRCVQALAAHDSLDAERLGFAGFGLGAAVGAAFCAEEPRVHAVALAAGRGGLGPVGVDPIGHIGRIAPRPLLLLNGAEPDERTAAFHAAARQPKREVLYDGPAEPVPDDAREEIGRFLAEALR